MPSRNGRAAPAAEAPSSDHMKTRTTGPERVAAISPPGGREPKADREIGAVAHSAASEAESGFESIGGRRHKTASQRGERRISPAMAAYDSVNDSDRAASGFKPSPTQNASDKIVIPCCGLSILLRKIPKATIIVERRREGPAPASHVKAQANASEAMSARSPRFMSLATISVISMQSIERCWPESERI